MTMSITELAALADQYFTKREARLALAREVEDLEEEEAALKTTIIKELIDSQATSIGGKLVKYELKKTLEPTIADGNWQPLYEHIRTTGDFDLIQRRLSASAIKERWENNVQIPGVTSFPVFKLSQSKVK